MSLQDAKDAVAFKYFREKWITLSDGERSRYMDEVAELYADNKVKNLAQPDVSGNEMALLATIREKTKGLNWIGINEYHKELREKLSKQ